MNRISETFMIRALCASNGIPPLQPTMLNGTDFNWELNSVAINWMKCGFPQIVPTHKLAASLCATTISASLLKEVEHPWSTFLIIVPDKLIVAPTEPEWEVGGIFVCQFDSGIRRAIIIGKDAMGFNWGPIDTSTSHEAESELKDLEDKLRADQWANRHTMDPDMLARYEEIERDREQGVVIGSPPGTPVSPFVQMVAHLAVGTMIELDSRPCHEKIALGPPNSELGHRRAADTLPKAWTFTLARDIKIDVRGAVRSYCLGGSKGKSPSVQSLVCGHSKRQAHGPNSSLRKWIHIQPYWKGPEDAPIAIKSHKMG